MADERPTRCALDGKRHTWAEFREYYGRRAGEVAWKEARQRGEFASASSAVPESMPQTSPSSASEHDRKINAFHRFGGVSASIASMEPLAPIQAPLPVAH